MSELICKHLEHHGEKRTMTLLKEYRTYLIRVALKQTNQPLRFRKTDSQGFPKVLKPWKELVHGSTCEVRLLFSLWRVIESFRIAPDRDTTSITKKSTADKSVMDRFIEWLPNWTGLRALPKTLPNCKIVLSNRAGPNGPATVSAYADLAGLRTQPELYESLKDLYRESSIPINLDSHESQVFSRTPRTGKLAFLADKACKTRIIAIGDWWSNVGLSPLHQAFMLGLERLKTDLTYKQSHLPKVIKSLGTLELYTSDLTAFTDRFPIEILEAVVSASYGPRLGHFWRNVISRRPFHISSNANVAYAVGNPMGLLSSWAISSFTHHAFKEWCAHLCGQGGKYKYLVLGDDCLDTRRDVYETYLTNIQAIGVETSPLKCTVSESGYAELAKRLFTPSGEVTGIPVDLLSECRKYPEQVIELVRMMRSRGYSDDTIRPGVQSLIATWKTRDTISFVLSSPEEALGMPPLLEGVQSSLQPIYWPTGDAMREILRFCRKEIFLREVDRIVETAQIGGVIVPPKGNRLPVRETHPALAQIGDDLMSYLNHGQGEDEYSIWNAWLAGDDQMMVHVPSIDQYRYKNRGHRVTAAKYQILSLARDTIADPISMLGQPERAGVSNFDLFAMGFPKEFHEDPAEHPFS